MNPNTLRFRGTYGRIPSDWRGTPDVIRTPRGAATVLHHPEASTRAIEIAVQAHGITRIVFEGPAAFHGHSVADRASLKAAMIDDLQAAHLWARKQFPGLDVEWWFDETSFATTDWSARRVIRRFFFECMDARLNHWLGRVYDAHESAAIIARWPGGLASMADPTMQECLSAELRLVADYLRETEQLLPAFEPTNHEDCAFLKLLGLGHLPESEKHRRVLDEVLPAYEALFDGFRVRPSVLSLDGEVRPLKPTVTH